MEKPTTSTVVDFTIPRRQISILAGASGAGKTTFIMQALAHWSRGEIFDAGFTFDATRIAYLVADRTCSEVRERAARLGIGDDKLEIYGIQDDLEFNLDLLKQPHKALDVALAKFTKPFDLLVIDPIALFVEGNFIDFHQVALSLMRLGRVAIKRDCTILATHHTTKMHSDWGFKRPQDRISGSGAFQGFSGTQMVLIQGLEDEKLYDTLWVIPHMGGRHEINIVRDETGEFEIFQKVDAEKMAFEEFRALILNQKGSGEEILTKEFFEFIDSRGLTRPITTKWAGDLIREGLVIKTGRGLYARTTLLQKESPVNG